MLSIDPNNIYGIRSTVRHNKYHTQQEIQEMLNLSEEFKSVLNRFNNCIDAINESYEEYLEECESNDISTDDDKILMSEIYELMSEEDIFNESVKERVADLKKNVKDKERAMDKAAASKVTDILDSIKEDIRDKHVEKIPFKLSRLIKVALASGLTLAVAGPVIGGITIITGLAVSKKLSIKEKDKLLSEIREELLIVEEKIKDADGNGDKEEKYQLMRLKNSLKRSEIRIKRSML